MTEEREIGMLCKIVIFVCTMVVTMSLYVYWQSDIQLLQMICKRARRVRTQDDFIFLAYL